MIRTKLAVSLVALLALAVTGCGKSAPTPGAGPSTGPVNPPAVSGSGSGTSATPGGSANPGGAATPGAAGNTAAPAPAPKPQSYEKVKLGPLKKGEMAKMGPLEVTLADITVIKQTAGLPAGYAYVLLNITVKNNGNAGYTINNSEHFKMTSPDGKPRSLNMQAMGQRSPTLSGTTDPGKTSTGWLGYMPKLEAGGKFVYLYTHPDYGDATWEFAVD